MTNSFRNLTCLVLSAVAMLAVEANFSAAESGSVVRIRPGSQTMLVDLWGAAVGSSGELTLKLPADISAYKQAILLLRVDDIDAAEEADMFVNNHGPVAWPQSILGEGEHGGAVAIDMSYLRPGANHFKFVFKDNLGGTTGGFGIIDAELDLFKDSSAQRLARMNDEAASWGEPIDWCEQELVVTTSNAAAAKDQQAPAVSDFFQDAPLARWQTMRGTWEKTEDAIEAYDIDQRDIYFSPEEPGHVAWVRGPVKLKDGSIEIGFVQITGDPGLEPSYRTTYGRRPWEEWVAWAKRSNLRIGPENAVSATKIEDVFLVTPDNGDTWEKVTLDSQKFPVVNINHCRRPVWAEDGTLVDHGMANLRCRDGRIVTTITGSEPEGKYLIGIRESVDNGKTWSPDQLIYPEGADEEIIKTCTAENDLVELDDGRILAMIRTDPGPPCQTYLTRIGPGQYTATPPTWTPMPNTGMPELTRSSDGIIWHWNLDGHWYSTDEGKSWHPLPQRIPSYYGKMINIGPNRLLCVTHRLTGDSPYPYWYDSSIRQYRFSYRTSGVMEQTDSSTALALLSRGDTDLQDLHLRAEVRLDGADGLAFRIQPDGNSYYVFAVILPGTAAYRRWFPEAEKANPVLLPRQTVADGEHAMAALARVDNGQLTVLRAIWLPYIPRGSWAPMQVKVTGDLLQGAVKCGPDPIYVGARDSTYAAGQVGLFTDQSTGAFKSFYGWSSPQMIRYLWQ